MFYLACILLFLSSLFIGYRVHSFFIDSYGFIMSIGLSLIVVIGLLYSGIIRSKQAIIFGIISLSLEVFSAIKPVINYIKINTSVIRLELPVEPERPERKTSKYWNTDRLYQKDHAEKMAAYNEKLAKYNEKLKQVTEYNMQNNRKKPDFWVLLQMIIDAIFSAIFLPAGVWLATLPIRDWLINRNKPELDNTVNQSNSQSIPNYILVYNLHKNKINVTELSKQFNVSRQTIYNWLRKAKNEFETVPDNSTDNIVKFPVKTGKHDNNHIRMIK